MRAINKGSEPVQLLQFRTQPNATYADMPLNVKNVVREALLAEQGHICAYCMQRIKPNEMKIEHWKSQSANPILQLAYSNLLGCCSGNEGQPVNEQHCDTRKGNNDIAFNPSDSAHHNHMRIRYLGDGAIKSDNAQFHVHMENILNLNFSRLKKNRKAIIDGVGDALNRKRGKRTKSEIQEILDDYNQNNSGQLKTFCGVAIYFLEKKLRIS